LERRVAQETIEDLLEAGSRREPNGRSHEQPTVWNGRSSVKSTEKGGTASLWLMARRLGSLLGAAALLIATSAPARASAMPEAPSCPVYADDDVWHSNISQMPVHPMSDAWIANMGGPTRLLHPDFGGPYG
jgi:hypothetical protein